MGKCRLCRSSDVQLVKKIDRFELIECFECKIVFVDPQPSRKKRIRGNLYKYNSADSKKTYLAMEEMFKKRAKDCIRILRFFQKNGKILDVGCSYGFYLKTFNQMGYDTVGIDISKNAVNYARNILRLKVFKRDFVSCSFKSNSFDTVTLFDVLEHFSDPNFIVKKIRKILKKDGVVIIQTPNYKSLMSRITGVNWYWLLVPEHLFLFSIASLKFCLEHNGFKVLKIYTWDDVCEFTSNVFDILGIKKKPNVVYKLLFKIMLTVLPLLSFIWNKKYLGGEILIYAQKREQ